MKHARVLWVGLLLLQGGVLAQPPAEDKEPPVEAVISVPTTEEIQGKLAELEKATELPAEARAALQKLYQEAANELGVAAQSQEKATRYRAQADPAAVTAEIARHQSDLEKYSTEPALDLSPDLSLPELERLLGEKTGQLETVRAESSALETEPARREQRRQEIPGRLGEIRTEIQKTDASLDKGPVANEPAELLAARRVFLHAKRHALSETTAALQAELAAYDQRGQALLTRRQVARRRIVYLEKEQTQLQEAVNAARQSKAEAAAREATRAEARVHPVLVGLAAQNTELAGERIAGNGEMAVAESIAEAKLRLSESKREYTDIEQNYEKARTRKRTTSRFARILQLERFGLPDARQLTRRLNRIDDDYLVALERLGEIDDRLTDLLDIDARVDEVMKAAVAKSPQVQQQIRSEAEGLFRDQLTLLSSLQRDYQTYTSTLDALSTQLGELLRITKEYSSFIEERLIWTRTDARLGPGDFLLGLETIVKNFAPSHLGRLGSNVGAVFETQILAVLVILLVLVVFAVQLPVRRRFDVLEEKAKSWRHETFSGTLEAVFHTIVRSLPLPALFLGLAWFSYALTTVPVATSIEEARPLEQGLQWGFTAAALSVLVLGIFRRMFRPDGVCDVHFRWPASVLRTVQRNARYLFPVAGALFFFYGFGRGLGVEEGPVALRRVVLVLFCATASLFCALVFRPKGAVTQAFIASRPKGWATRLRYPIYGLLVILPLLSAILTVLGYSYAGITLVDELWQTFQLLVVILIFDALVHRWLFITRRRLAIDKARKRKEKELAERAAAAGAGSGDVPAVPELVESEINIVAMDQKTKSLTRSVVGFALILGLWWIWYDQLPALRALDDVRLWTDASVVVDGQAKVISLASLVLCAVMVTMTYLAARNIPALLDFALQRMGMEAGVRYAVVTVATYAIVAVGMALSFNAIGLGWAKVQWLIAAMSVGLGFGLQEIFANFVSGLILLFERPIRIGDMVTVGDITGTVSRIQIRATTIVDYDNRELVVPNKNFIAGQIINWTLTDTVTRVVIPVGVAYGSDTQKARELLVKIARECEYVTDDPAPTAVFSRFGDSTLELSLRVFLPTRDNWRDVMNELHTSIHDEFGRAGIEIAFPQRDLHIRSGAINLVQPSPSAEQGSTVDQS